MPKNAPLVVGLTGQTGAGKTTISKVFAEAGFVVLNCDLIARKVISSPEVLSKLVSYFGSEILKEDGTLDRRMLAAKSFADAAGLNALNGITHPPILEEISKEIDELYKLGEQYILLDAPTLFESGADAFCDKKIAVLANADVRRERIIRRDNLSAEEAARRMSAQKEDGFFKLRCDYCLYNNGTEKQLEDQGISLARSFTSPKKRGKSVWVLVLIAVASIFLIKIGYEFAYKQLYPKKYESAVSTWSQQYGVDENLVYAVIKCESGFDPQALSSVGAVGLMQITEDAYDWANFRLGKTGDSFSSLYDPETNIQYGAYLLSLLQELFGDEKTAVSAYHAGQGNVAQWLTLEEYSADGKTLDDIPFPTTEEYVKRVFEAKAIYEKLY